MFSESTINTVGFFQSRGRGILFTVTTKKSYLDCFDQVGGAVGHLLGRLDKVPLGNWVGCLGRSQTAGIAQG